MNRLWRLGIALCTLTAGLAGLGGCENLSHRAATEPAPVARGKAIYERHCVACHATRGTGDSFLAVPALAGQRFDYLRQQIERFSSDERHSPRMRWALSRVSMNTPLAASDVASYLSQLPVMRFAEGDPRFHAQGEASFVAHCAACHGMDAEGRADGPIPSLRAQHDSYLVGRLRRFSSESPTAAIGAHALDDHSIIAIAAYLSSLRGEDIHSPSPPQP